LTILEAYKKSAWGYSLKYFISASNDCHPNYVTYLMDKKTLSIKSINEILEIISAEKKLMYDKAYIEHLYLEYQKKEDSNDFEDFKKLKVVLQGRKVLLLASGHSVVTEREKIQNYISEHSPIVIAVNYLPNYDVHFIFISNSRRYVQLSSRINKLDQNTKLIATSNVTKTKGKFDYTLEYSALLDEQAEYADNPMIMLIKVLDACETEDVILAGFDGYSTGITSDYVNPELEYSFSKTKAMEINKDAIASLNRLTTKVSKHFLTKSYYVKDSTV
jgi:4-hydroxy 2-oxovalerate aldolase